MKKKILFITTLSLSTNPRLVKEIALAKSNNFDCEVWCFSFGQNHWAEELNKKIINDFSGVIFCILPTSKHKFWIYIPVQIFYLISKIILPIFKNSIYLLSFSLYKRSIILFFMSKLKKCNASIVIVHNPGAFQVGNILSNKYKIPLGVDMEDYHPGEYTQEGRILKEELLLKKTLKNANYISSASWAILEQTKKVTYNNTNNFVLLNAFPKEDFNAPTISDINSPLKIVWFSQNISSNRGLELIIDSLHLFDVKLIELHLIGNIDNSFIKDNKFNQSNIIFHKPMSQKKLNNFLLLMDVGLAIENKFTNMNRDICVTNKIIAYYQANLFILASKTKGQLDFFEKHKPNGYIFEDKEEFIHCLDSLTKNKFKIKSRTKQFSNENLNWESESKKLLHVWRQLLQIR